MFFFKQKTAYEMRSSDWSSDVCSSSPGHEGWLQDRPEENGPDRRGRGPIPGHGTRQFPRVEANQIGQESSPSLLKSGCFDRSSDKMKKGFPGDAGPRDRKNVVSGKSVSVRVDLGGRRIIKKKSTKVKIKIKANN